AVARRLYHCRDLGENEPFDFLTWFEYGPSDSPAFDELVAELRASEEWSMLTGKLISDLYVMQPNESMKPTSPLRYNFGVFATTPAVAYLFLVRRNHARST